MDTKEPDLQDENSNDEKKKNSDPQWLVDISIWQKTNSGGVYP